MINIIAFLGPSGVGKSTLQSLLDIQPIVTWTSRLPRKGEINGVNYHFTTKDTIMHMYEQGALLEFTHYNENLYGTALDSINELIATEKIASIIVDGNGANELRKKYRDHVLILGVYAPIEECILRLTTRGDSDSVLRIATYHDEVQLMQTLADFTINNSRANWDRSVTLMQLLLKGIR